MNSLNAGDKIKIHDVVLNLVNLRAITRRRMLLQIAFLMKCTE